MTNVAITTVADAQRDMREAYYGGAPGMFASAMVWGAAGVVALNFSPTRAITTLFIGGMFIHPIGVVIAKLLGRQGAHATGNPLGALALETTVLLLLGFPLAYGMYSANTLWFFPAMLLVIGGRYFTFATLYGLRVYWVCGGLLAVVGMILVAQRAPFFVGAFAGSAIELVFAARLFAVMRADTDVDARV